MKAISICSYVGFCFSPSLVCKELLWADQSVSEHRVPLQHELLGGDDWLVRRHESKHQPEFSLSLSYISGNLNQGENWHLGGSKNGVYRSSHIFVVRYRGTFIFLLLIKIFIDDLLQTASSLPIMSFLLIYCWYAKLMMIMRLAFIVFSVGQLALTVCLLLTKSEANCNYGLCNS